jgi:hypothetical protein
MLHHFIHSLLTSRNDHCTDDGKLIRPMIKITGYPAASRHMVAGLHADEQHERDAQRAAASGNAARSGDTYSGGRGDLTFQGYFVSQPLSAPARARLLRTRNRYDVP